MRNLWPAPPVSWPRAAATSPTRTSSTSTPCPRARRSPASCPEQRERHRRRPGASAGIGCRAGRGVAALHGHAEGLQATSTPGWMGCSACWRTSAPCRPPRASRTAAPGGPGRTSDHPGNDVRFVMDRVRRASSTTTSNSSPLAPRQRTPGGPFYRAPSRRTRASAWARASCTSSSIDALAKGFNVGGLRTLERLDIGYQNKTLPHAGADDLHRAARAAPAPPSRSTTPTASCPGAWGRCASC